MMGCVSAIDGVVFEIRQPSHNDVEDIMAYRNMKGMWGVVVLLAGCDSNCRFNMLSAKYSGTTNDALAWELSAMKRIVEGSNWPIRFYVIGD